MFIDFFGTPFLESPWGGVGKFCLGESQSRIYPNMCAKFGSGPTVVSKGGGGGGGYRQTDKGTPQLYIVDLGKHVIQRTLVIMYFCSGKGVIIVDQCQRIRFICWFVLP